ncbi:MAG: hypothetical protein JWP34_1469 [Massilia sp.]|nr:hypothetical protein [Massilia sp.]
MNKVFLLGASMLMLSACSHDKQTLDSANVTKAMASYFETRGDLCLAKSEWPIDVADEEGHSGSRNALQMPALERVGLVESSKAQVERTAEDGTKSTVNVTRYRLTDGGKKYYLPRAPHKFPSTNRYANVDHDFCAAKLSLDKIVGWESPAADGPRQAVVTYTYKLAPAPWTADAGVRQVFPMVDTVIRGAGTLQLKETLVLTDAGWEAKDL